VPSRPDVVVDRELAGAHLGRRTLGRFGCPAFQPDQLELVGLVSELGTRVVVGDHPANEGLPLVDDALHGLLEGLDVVGGEGGVDVEVVVEAVAHGRADAEAGLGVSALHRLGENVSGRVPQHRQAVRRVHAHRLDGVAVGELMSEVTQLAADPGDDHGVRPFGRKPTLLEQQLARRRPRGHRQLVAGDGHGDLGGHEGLLLQ
jgi:hypothetical protein